MLAGDFADLGLVGHQRRGLVGKVNPHDVVRFQFPGFQRLVGLDRRLAGSAPGVPEIDQHDLALAGRDDGVEKLVGGHVGRLFDLHLAFQRRQLPAYPGLNSLARLGVERILQRTERGEVSLGEFAVRGFRGHRNGFAQIYDKTVLCMDNIRPVESRVADGCPVVGFELAHQQFRVIDVEQSADSGIMFRLQCGKFVVDLCIAVPKIVYRAVVVFEKTAARYHDTESLLLEREQVQFLHHLRHAAAGDAVGQHFVFGYDHLRIFVRRHPVIREFARIEIEPDLFFGPHVVQHIQVGIGSRRIQLTVV